MNCTQPSSSVHGIFQVRILEWDLPNPGIDLVSLAMHIHEEAEAQESSTWNWGKGPQSPSFD